MTAHGDYKTPGSGGPGITVINFGATRTRKLSPGPTYGHFRVDTRTAPPHDDGVMTSITREEVAAKLEASEARVATAVEAMRADAAELRAELREGHAQQKAQAEQAQAEASKFYAEAGRVLAEIRLAGEQNKTALMSIGYKAATWTLATFLALASFGIAAYNAMKRPAVQASPPTTIEPAGAAEVRKPPASTTPPAK